MTMEPRVEGFAYAGFETPEYERWSIIGPAVFGMQLADAEPDRAVRLRLDELHHRIAVYPGERNRVAYLGWSVANSAALAALAENIEATGLRVEHGDEELRRVRHVRELATFTDPFGLRHELAVGFVDQRPLTPGRPMRGRFVTGDGGLGHAVLMADDQEASTAFYRDVMGFKLSDTIQAFTELRFFHVNPRHHSLALVRSPGVRGLHHMMIEVDTLDDVGIAYDLLDEYGVPVAMTLGRHPNDRMFSFYCRVPGGFEIEYGWGAFRIEDQAQWTPVEFDRISEWGHKMLDVGQMGMIEVLQRA